jgi:hypothetical protein
VSVGGRAIRRALMTAAPVLGDGHQMTGPTIRVSAPVNALTLAQWVRRRHSITTSWNIHARPGSETQSLLQKARTLRRCYTRCYTSYRKEVTRVVTTVSKGVLQTSRGGRPQVCADGHIQLECSMGFKLWSVGREPNSGTAWTRRSRTWRCGWPPSMGRGACLFRAESATAQALKSL